LAPGFAVVFGGPSVIPDAAISEISRLLSGGTTLGDAHLQPRLTSTTLTRLSMAPVYADITDTALGAGAERICMARGAYRNARWLVVDGVAATTSATGQADVMMQRRYRVDSDGVARTPETGAPVCVAVMVPPTATSLTARAVGLSGRSTTATAATTVNVTSATRLSLTGGIAAASPGTGTGVASGSDTSGGGVTEWSYSTIPSGLSVVSRGQSTTITSASTVITLTRGLNNATATGPDTFTATFTLETPLGTVVGSASGEALLAGGVWRLRGVSTFSGGSWNVASGAGGFTADITVNDAGFVDDAITWRLDGVVS
jgi:hypothetical protein